MLNKSIIEKASISLLSIFLGILIAELFAKRLGLGNPLLYDPDNLVGYRLKPNQTKYRRRGALVSTNSEGFRINPLSFKDKNTNYLVFVGDSVTFGGTYIDDKNLFSSKYCELLNKNFYCLNNGLNAWGVLNMGRFIANFEIYSKKEPYSFILVILPGDEGRNLKSLSDTPFWDFPPKEPSALNEIIRYINKKYFLNYLKNKEFEKDYASDLNQKIINQTQKNIIWDELEELLKKSKYPINVVITPPKKWFKENLEFKEIKIYEEYLSEISKLPIIKNTCNLYKFLKNDYNDNLYVDGVHLSNEGHELWAKKIKECLYDK
mgnify:CR=1 FL=1